MAHKRTREVEQSKMILSMNWKEEMLLQKRLSLLDSLKRQVADFYSLDQRVVYRRFRGKLWRSELAHARLMGRKELVERLRQVSALPSFHTTVSDGSQAAVRGILQRAASSPLPSSPSAGGRTVPGTARGVGSRHHAARPHTSAAAGPEQRPYTAARTSGEFVPRGGRVRAVQPDLEPGWEGSSRTAAMTRDSPLYVFLNLGEREEKRPLLEIHAYLSGRMQLEEKVKSFLQHSPGVGDYHPERLQALGTQPSPKPRQLSAQLDQEAAPWHFVGKELHHRSMTFKKLDEGFCSSGCPC